MLPGQVDLEVVLPVGGKVALCAGEGLARAVGDHVAGEVVAGLEGALADGAALGIVHEGGARAGAGQLLGMRMAVVVSRDLEHVMLLLFRWAQSSRLGRNSLVYPYLACRNIAIDRHKQTKNSAQTRHQV